MIGREPAAHGSLLFLAVVGVAACGPAPDKYAPQSADAEEIARGISRGFGLTSAFIQAGAIQTTQPAGSAVQALKLRAGTETNNCATVVINGLVVSATFDGNGATGCKLASVGLTVGGSVDVTVSGGMGSDILLSFNMHLTVDGKALSGYVTASTSDGNQYKYGTSKLGWDGGATATVPKLTAGYDTIQTTVSGVGTMTGRSGTDLKLQLDSVETAFADCYPDGGDVVISLPTGDVVVSFTEPGARSGVAVIGDPTASTIFTQLPARTNCPR